MNEFRINLTGATEPQAVHKGSKEAQLSAEDTPEQPQLSAVGMEHADYRVSETASPAMLNGQVGCTPSQLHGELKDSASEPDQALAPSPCTDARSCRPEVGGSPVHPTTPWGWPAPMHPAAFHGLAGEVIDIISPHTESDPAGLLLIFLAAFGNIAGTSAHFLAATRRHPMRLWANLVGDTAKGRKGSAWSSVRYFLNAVAPAWTQRCVQSGISSGEGLIWSVRDPVIGLERSDDGSTQQVTKDPGVTDKRLFVIEEEFSLLFKRAARAGNTISDVLRQAWDDGTLATLTKKCPAYATGAHITASGHITISILRQLMTETEALNGFGNRFLWACVRRFRLLPEGGALHQVDLSSLCSRIRHALDFAGSATLIERTPAARKYWCELYPVLTSDRPGLLGAITNRAEAQVMRLALTYAMLDASPQIDVSHLRAALALWDYCERSAAYIFGAGLGDRVAERLLEELRLAGSRGLSLTAIRDVFQRNISADRITIALAHLEQLQFVVQATAGNSAKGRKAIIWRYVEQQHDQRPRPGPIESYLSFLS